MSTAPVRPIERAAPSGGAAPLERWWARREDVRLLTGTATYVGDVDREEQVYLRVVRNVVPHGRLIGIGTAAAAALPGVLRVLTAADLDAVPRIPLRNRTRPELDSFLQPVLAVDRVRYVGEPVAVVVATSAALAEDAAELVVVDVEPLPAVVVVDDFPEVPVWEHAPDGTMCRFHGGDGDVHAALAEADVVVTGEFSTGRDTGMPLETRGLVAEWAEDGTLLHLWGPTKFVRFTRQTVAAWFGVEPDRVVCHHVDVGGMFGTRGEVYPEDFLVPWAASVVGVPVKWVEDSNEHLLAINHSRDQTHRVTAAARASGELLALRVDSVVDFGAYARPIGGRPAESVLEGLPGPYRWPNLDLVSRAVATNKTPAGNMRAPSAFDATFARERVMDMLAAELGRDPVELRRQNLIPAVELPFTRPFGAGAHAAERHPEPPVHDAVYDSGDYPYSLDRLLDRISFPDVVAQIRQRRQEGELVGYGIACFLGHSGTGREETIRLDLTPEGRFRFVTLGSEIGQGLASLIATVGADALGVSEDDVDVVTNDTTDYGEGTGTFGSRSAVFVGSAVVDAAAQLRGAAPRLADGAPDWGRATARTVIGHHASAAPTYGFGAHFAVVSVDPDTVDVRVERLVVAYDCGRAIHPGSVRGQLVGASIQALGGTLFQELVHDASGQPQSTTLLDFQLPTFADSPEVETVVLELPGTTSNPLGVKGAGEAGSMGVGGAVANAVSAALSAPAAVTRLPLRPDALLAFLPEDVGPPRPAQVPPTAVRPSRGQAPVTAVGVAFFLGAATGFQLLRRARARHGRRGVPAEGTP